jgi:hypothetical protein
VRGVVPGESPDQPSVCTRAPTAAWTWQVMRWHMHMRHGWTAGRDMDGIFVDDDLKVKR